MNIPKILHQLWIGDIAPAPLNLMNTWKDKNPEYEYIFWNEDRISKEFNNRHVPHNYLEKIEDMEEINGKADMYRWLILKKYGGIFVDADMICIHPFTDKFLEKSWFCWEQELIRRNLCATTIMGFTPNHKIVNDCIEYITKSYIKGKPAWISVGPKLLTKKYHESHDQIKNTVNIFPSYFFLPHHFTGLRYNGHGKVYGTHFWGSANNNNRIKELNDLKLPDEYLPPSQKNIIHLDIKDIEENQLDLLLNSLIHFEGRYNIMISLKGDLQEKKVKELIEETRWVNYIRAT
jgi:mannosyltransferase OCH1-like enzyme